MITLARARRLIPGSPVRYTDPVTGAILDTSVSHIDDERLHIDNDSIQFILANCPDGIPGLDLPEATPL
jgi:hypothetical protein